MAAPSIIKTGSGLLIPVNKICYLRPKLSVLHSPESAILSASVDASLDNGMEHRIFSCDKALTGVSSVETAQALESDQRRDLTSVLRELLASEGRLLSLVRFDNRFVLVSVDS